LEAITECAKIWEGRPIGCLISLGTGLQDPSQLLDRSGTGIVNRILRRVAPAEEYKLTVAKYLVGCLTNCERVHSSISSQLNQYNLRGRYHRLNPHGMGGIGLQEWEKIGDIKALAESYMMHGEMGDLKVKLAKSLLDPSIPDSVPTISQPILDPPQQAKLGQNTLHLAALNGSVHKVRQILNQEYVGLNEKESERGWTPLMCAVSEGHDAVVKLLLEAWAKTDIPGQQLLTPLHLAVIKGREGIVRLLLQKDPETNTKDIHGQTALHYAVARGELDGIVRLLLQNGADFGPENVDGNSPLNIAICDGTLDLVDFLLRVRGGSEAVQRALDETGLIDGESGLRWQAEAKNNPVGLTALFMAIEAKRMEVVSLIGEKYLSDLAWSEAIEDAFQMHAPEVPCPSWESFKQTLIDIGQERLRDGGLDNDNLDEFPLQYGTLFSSGSRRSRVRVSAAYQDDDEYSTSSHSLFDD
jgi:ankyrin repeat protein